jgi:hypothetical protein
MINWGDGQTTGDAVIVEYQNLEDKPCEKYRGKIS